MVDEIEDFKLQVSWDMQTSLYTRGMPDRRSMPFQLTHASSVEGAEWADRDNLVGDAKH